VTAKFRTNYKAALATALGACLVSSPAFAGDDFADAEVAYSIVTISGGELTNGAREGYSGAYYSFNRDFSRDGFIGRIYGSVGRYDFEYDAGGQNGTVDGDYWSGDVMFGYQWVRNGLDFSVLLGGDYQDREAVLVDPVDPINSGRYKDDEFGFKVLAEVESNGNGNSPIYFNLGGSYSTAFDTYYALGRLGYSFDHLTIGPEAWALGDDSGDAQRLGGFAMLDFDLGTTASTITVSGGYQFAEDGYAGEFGEEGGYVTVEFSMALGEHRSVPLK